MKKRQRQRFLKQSRFAGAKMTALSADMSFRRYYRLSDATRPALLMDAPPPREDLRPFIKVAGHLHALGLSAPALYDRDVEQGFLILEDFGEDTYTRLLAAGGNERALYELAIDTLCELHRQPRAVDIDLPSYDVDTLLREALLLPEWYLPWLRKCAVDEDLCHSFREAWRELLSRLPKIPRQLVLRDFHVDNLVLLPGRTGVAACGLLDFQDALLGPAAYDVMSLLEDARRDIPAALAQQMLQRYRRAMAMNDHDFDDFMIWYRALAAQRHCKVLGIFVRFQQRQGNAMHLKHLPRVRRLLYSHLHREELAPLASWLEQAGGLQE